MQLTNVRNSNTYILQIKQNTCVKYNTYIMLSRFNMLS